MRASWTVPWPASIQRPRITHKCNFLWQFPIRALHVRVRIIHILHTYTHSNSYAMPNGWVSLSGGLHRKMSAVRIVVRQNYRIKYVRTEAGKCPKMNVNMKLDGSSSSRRRGSPMEVHRWRPAAYTFKRNKNDMLSLFVRVRERVCVRVCIIQSVCIKHYTNANPQPTAHMRAHGIYLHNT